MTENFILEWNIPLLSKAGSQACDSWIGHVRWNVAGTVSQMRQRLCHRGPTVPKCITPSMEHCSGNAQCPTMDTNCWLSWKFSSSLIYNMTSEVLEWALCLHMTTGQQERIWASTIVVMLTYMHAHHALIENILLMNIKKQLHKCGSVSKVFFCMSQVCTAVLPFLKAKRLLKSPKLHLSVETDTLLWRGGLTLSRFSPFVTKALWKQTVCWHASLMTGTLECPCWYCSTIGVVHFPSESTRN